MNVFRHFHTEVVSTIKDVKGVWELAGDLDTTAVVVGPPPKASFGDLSSNAALVISVQLGRPPQLIAEPIVRELGRNPDVLEVKVAGPGFINLRLKDDFWRKELREVLEKGTDYGFSELREEAKTQAPPTLATPEATPRREAGPGRAKPKVNVEYVSANPTGPLHVGHARGAVFGDALAALLERAGFEVTREFYVNDAGAQLEALARSVYFRYREALGEDVGEMPDGFYPGEYLVPVGKALAERDGKKWLSIPEQGRDGWREACANFGRDRMLALIRDDLDALGVHFDDNQYKFERPLHQEGHVQETLDWLKGRELVYEGVLEPPKGRKPEDWEPREQTLFRATKFGDEVDRPLRKSDGSWTYFAADIAYHRDKIERGFDLLIDVWGADHAGYVERMKAAVNALSDGKVELDVKICQLVNVLEGGEPVKMSKRAGAFVTLREVVDAVGKDVVRFIMLTRRNDAPLDFDLVHVREQSKDNPVFYVQYAHARVCSLMRHAAEAFPDLDLSPKALAEADLGRLTDSHELDLIKRLATWPRVVEGAAETHEPHRLASYLYDLAAAFHALWTKGKEEAPLRFLVAEDRALTAARMALVRAVGLVIASGLAVFGVTPVEEMR